MNRSLVLALAVVASATAALAESVVLEDYNGKGVLSKALHFGVNNNANNVNKHPGYFTLKWKGGYGMYMTTGKTKVDLSQSGSLSFEYRTTKKGENFDADRAVEIKLYVLEGVQKGYIFRYATDSLIDDGDWHRVTIPMSEFVTYDKIPAKTKLVYAFAIGINSYSQDEDKLDVDFRDIVAHSDVVDGVTQMPVEAAQEAEKTVKP